MANFTFTVKSDNAGTSNDDQFTLPLPSAGTYDCVIDWGDGGAPEAKNTNTSVTHTFAGGAGTYTITISGTFPQIYFNNGGDKLKLLSVEDLGDVGWTSFINAFYGCASMTSFDGGTTNTASVTTMHYMFNGCSGLTSLDVSGFDTALVTTMHYMFSGCSGLTSLDVSGFDISSMTSATNMFLSSAFSQRNYDLLLVAWEAQVEKPNVTFHAGTAQYSSGAPTTAKAALATSGWNITDGGQSTIVGWSDEASATIVSDTSPHSGTNCLKDTAGAVNVGANQTVPLILGKYYTIAGWCKATAGDTAEITIDKGDGTALSVGTVTATIWTPISASFAALGTFGIVYLRGQASGDVVWFDDVSVVRDDTAAATAASRVPDYADGKIEEVAVWDRGLSAEEAADKHKEPYKILR